MHAYLQPLANATLLMAAAAYALLFAIAGAAGLLGIPLGVLVALSLWRYGYAVLRTFAQGHRNLAAPALETMNPVGEWILVAHFVLFAAFGYFLLTTPLLGAGEHVTAARWIALLGLGFAFPASAALLALTQSLEAAVNLSSMGTLIGVFGRQYLLLIGVCAALLALSAFAHTAVLPALGWPGVLAGRVLGVWEFLAVFALIGSAVRSRRDAFDVPGEVRPPEEREMEERDAARQVVLDRAYGSLRSGLAVQGQQTLERLIQDEGENTDIYAWLLARMLEWEDKSHALRLAERFIDKLLAEGMPQDALDVSKRCRFEANDFALSDSTAAALASHARSIGWLSVADDLTTARAPQARKL